MSRARSPPKKKAEDKWVEKTIGISEASTANPYEDLVNKFLKMLTMHVPREAKRDTLSK